MGIGIGIAANKILSLPTFKFKIFLKTTIIVSKLLLLGGFHKLSTFLLKTSLKPSPGKNTPRLLKKSVIALVTTCCKPGITSLICSNICGILSAINCIAAFAT